MLGQPAVGADHLLIQQFEIGVTTDAQGGQEIE